MQSDEEFKSALLFQALIGKMTKERIYGWCTGKKVLQLGVLGDYKDYLTTDFVGWDFAQIAKAASKAVGVDIDKEGVRRMQEKGFDVRFGDAEHLDLGEQFDIIFAGDLIEHLTNVRGFFESCKKHMVTDAKLVITTPNPYSLELLLRAFWCTVSPAIYEDHTMLIQERNMHQLAKRFDFKLEEVSFFSNKNTKSVFGRIMSGCLRFCAFFKKSFHQNYMFVLVKE